MNTNTDALLPCPFCGGDMVMKKSVKAKDSRYSVRCVEQECIMHGGSYPIAGGKRAAIDLANTRTTQPSVTSEDIAKVILDALQRNDCQRAYRLDQSEQHHQNCAVSFAVQAILTAFHVSRKE